MILSANTKHSPDQREMAVCVWVLVQDLAAIMRARLCRRRLAFTHRIRKIDVFVRWMNATQDGEDKEGRTPLQRSLSVPFCRILQLRNLHAAFT